MSTAPDVPVMAFRVTRQAGDPHVADFAGAEQRDLFATELAETSNSIVYTSRWEPTPQSLLLADGWIPEAHIAPGLVAGDYITISLTIDNYYERHAAVTTTFTNLRIPAPPDEDDKDAFHNWAYAHIHAFTGVGHEDGNSRYHVTVTACSDPSQLGRQFNFG